MKILISPDSYKGTLTARAAASIMERAVLSVMPDAEVICLPVADGGEGTLDVLGCTPIEAVVSGPLFDKVSAVFGIQSDSGKNGCGAVIEMASCAGLPLIDKRKDPAAATTYGVGELILCALDRGCRDIVLTLGGSATNDLGCGMAAALGVAFYGRKGRFIPTGGTLDQIEHIDMSGIDKRIAQCNITAMCDVDNVLYGKNGAAYVFAPQKGADEATVERLDDGLHHAAQIIERDCGIEVSALKGGGAAGGMGAAVAAFLGGSLKRGIDTVLDKLDFGGRLEGASLILTGEGRYDTQSQGGKVVSGIAARAFAAGVPCVVIAGSVERDIPELNGVTAAFSIQTEPLPFEEAVKYTESNLYNVTRNVIKLFTAK